MSHQASIKKSYVKTLRRAFLLRIHPDRFRQQSNTIRKEQASLVQAIEEWISSPAVLAYFDSRGFSKSSNLHRGTRQHHQKQYPYHLERSDGTLSRHMLTLNAPVDHVFQGIAASLTELGVNLPSFPTPSPILQSEAATHVGVNTTATDSSMHHEFSGKGTTHEIYEQMHRFVWSSHSAKNVDEQFDIMSRQGKNLPLFLQQLQHKDILLRKQQRLAAVASALVTRRAYQFQAVDGTGIGWSSESVTKCFHSLTKLFDEHRHRLHVTSFYPLRLELSKDERQSQLCRYGAKLYLNPLDTPLQWLNTFRLVTPEVLREVKLLQEKLLEYTKSVQNGLTGSVTFKRGHSCSSADYHDCMKRLAANNADDLLSSARQLFPSESSSLLCTGASIQVIVESSDSPRIRRNMVTREGHIRVSTHMQPNEIIACILKLAERARQEMAVESQLSRERDELVKQLIYFWNLETINTRSSHVTTAQAVECLCRLCNEATTTAAAAAGNHDIDNRQRNFDWRQHLEGQSISISSSGQFCHIADDGSIIIPWNYYSS